MLSQPMIKRPASLQARSLTGPIEMIGATMSSAVRIFTQQGNFAEVEWP
jgi:hypothetical protein